MNFDVKKETNKIINFIKSYFKDNKLDGIVMGISGGKDSTIVSALFTKALGKENVIGITIPCNSLKEDELDAARVADYIGFKLYHFDLSNVYNSYFNELNTVFDFDLNDTMDSSINLKPRLRMACLYYVAQAFSKKHNKRYIVAGTSNKCEIYVGYFTKFGDGASDINIFGDLTVSEVLAIGDYLGLPKDLVHKIPSDGLSGQSDEERLGVTYKQIEKTISGEIRNKKIEKMHLSSLHKTNPISLYRKVDVKEITKDIIKNLIKNTETVATMESCTSGLLASTITNLSDVSKVFKLGSNTYSDEAKIKDGVSKETIDNYGVYSLAVAKEMALNITKKANSDYGIGITGKLKSRSFSESKVYISIYVKKENKYYNKILKFREVSKYLGKVRVVKEVICKLGEIINENKKS
jgi:NAD+ synthase